MSSDLNDLLLMVKLADMRAVTLRDDKVYDAMSCTYSHHHYVHRIYSRNGQYDIVGLDQGAWAEAIRNLLREPA